MKIKLDEFDLLLLEALFQDARASNKRLAQSVGLSESATLIRLRHLEEIGLITGFHTQIAFERLGTFQSWADVTLIDDRPSTLAAFEALIEDDPDIWAATAVSGDAHFRLHVVSVSFEARQDFAERLLDRRDLVRKIDWRSIYKTCRVRSHFVRGALVRLVSRKIDQET